MGAYKVQGNPPVYSLPHWYNVSPANTKKRSRYVHAYEWRVCIWIGIKLMSVFVIYIYAHKVNVKRSECCCHRARLHTVKHQLFFVYTLAADDTNDTLRRPSTIHNARHHDHQSSAAAGSPPATPFTTFSSIWKYTMRVYLCLPAFVCGSVIYQFVCDVFYFIKSLSQWIFSTTV